MISSDGEGIRRIHRPYSALVVTALSNFTNTTLSSLYFDITKDTLYANTLDSIERRSAVTVLEKVCGSSGSIGVF
jgi:isoleucyl-tRNA synthetase